jgi:hypothetical protein
MEKRKIKPDDPALEDVEPINDEDLTVRENIESEEPHYPPGDEDDSDDERPDENEAVRGK